MKHSVLKESLEKEAFLFIKLQKEISQNLLNNSFKIVKNLQVTR